MPYTEAELAHEADRARFYDPLILRQFRKQYDTELPATAFEQSSKSYYKDELIDSIVTLSFVGFGMALSLGVGILAQKNQSVIDHNSDTEIEEVEYEEDQESSLILGTIVLGTVGGLALKKYI